MLKQNMASASGVYHPANYPCTYVASTTHKVGATVVSALLACLGMLGLWHFLPGVSGMTGGDTTRQVVMSILSLIVLLISPLCALGMFYYRIVLRADSIELRGFFGRKTLERNRIANWRVHLVNRKPIFELTSVDSHVKPLRFFLQFQTDSAFSAWFAGLPNAAGLPQSGDVIIQMEGMLSKQAVMARRVEHIFTIVMIGIACSMLFSSQSTYSLLLWIVLALPWLAIVAVWMDKASLNAEQRQAANTETSEKVNVIALLFFPSIILLLATTHSNTYLLYWYDAIIPVLAMAILMFMPIVISNNRHGRAFSQILSYVFLSILYAVSAISLTNAAIDHSAPTGFQSTILARYETHGKSTAHHFRLSAWGPLRASSDINVPWNYYSSKTTGDIIYINLHSGFYRMPWYTIGDCIQSSNASL